MVTGSQDAAWYSDQGWGTCEFILVIYGGVKALRMKLQLNSTKSCKSAVSDPTSMSFQIVSNGINL